ncbi:MAG: YceI family protein [Pirellulales bacterium]
MHGMHSARRGVFDVVAIAVMLLAMGRIVMAQNTAPATVLRETSGQTTTGQGSPAPIVYEPGDIYLAGSRAYALVGKTGFGHEHGVIGQLLPSKLQLGATQNAGRLDFDLRTFSADDDAARKYVGLEGATAPATRQEVNANMLGAAVLDVGHFPAASFVVRSAQRLPQPSQRGLVQYQLDGDFTFHGVTRPLSVVAEAEEQGGWTKLRGGFRLVQSQFGITPFSKAFGAVGVADEVKVYGDLWIAKERQVMAATASR